ncbi:hypothetical protein PHISCL_02288 [Aspergillus sclerotialis]|uniref:Uncharacterized protein n=1 Tax=Aspergillus sclerotialis TaxID=2070753 RepID=A0A3A2ZVH8_9EURO|nr:hypothetical protein PHISCL_02288 [Aspergillus sclerotialis]
MTDDLPFGPLSIVERLYGYRAYEDGSFSHVYGMDEPVEYHNGSFWGDWEVLDVKATRKGQTSIVWTIYACFTLEGGFDHFHESAINNITAILQREGKSAGYSVKPYSRNTAWPYFTLVQDVMGGPGLW